MTAPASGAPLWIAPCLRHRFAWLPLCQHGYIPAAIDRESRYVLAGFTVQFRLNPLQEVGAGKLRIHAPVAMLGAGLNPLQEVGAGKLPITFSPLHNNRLNPLQEVGAGKLEYVRAGCGSVTS